MQWKDDKGNIHQLPFESAMNYLKVLGRIHIPYATTIHLIASGLIKLSQLQPALPLYRGLNNKKSLPSK